MEPSSRRPLRVVSLLPSATDVFAAILHEAELFYPKERHKTFPILVGRSHECDRPKHLIETVPILTAPKTTFTTSGDVHRQVTGFLNNSTSLYYFDTEKFRQLQPDIVLTQDLCSVCAIDLKTVENAVQQIERTSSPKANGSSTVDQTTTTLPPPPKDPSIPVPVECLSSTCGETTSKAKADLNSCTIRRHMYNAEIISLNPTNTKEVLIDQMLQVGKALQLEEAAEIFIQKMKQRINQCLQRVKTDKEQLSHCFPPKILFLEWLFPPYVGGHWTPELITMAGGLHPYNPPVKKEGYVYSENDPLPFNGSLKRISPAVYPKELVKENADIVVICPCGLTLPEALKEIEREMLETKANIEESMQWYWPQLRAIQNQQIYVLDGNLMFNRPGPYMIYAFEFLTDLVHLYHTAPTKRLDPKNYIFDFQPWTKTIEEVKAKGSQTPMYSIQDIENLHLTACSKGESMYTDPNTQCSVLTAFYHENRRTCCGNACRHCPYGHANVKEAIRRTNKVKKVIYLLPKDSINNPLNVPSTESPLIQHWKTPVTSQGLTTTTLPNYSLATGRDQLLELADEKKATVIFWSGGKDAFLSLYEFLRLYTNGKGFQQRKIVLFSTIQADSNIAAIQNTTLQLLVAQAQSLRLPICIAPLQTGDTKEYIAKSQEAMQGMDHALHCGEIDSMIFGDLFLTDIRNWRESVYYPAFQQTKGIASKLSFIYPVWLRPETEELIPLLNELCETYHMKIQYSGIYAESMIEKGMKEKDEYLPEKLPSNVDPMGENGEFHTEVHFPSEWMEVIAKGSSSH